MAETNRQQTETVTDADFVEFDEPDEEKGREQLREECDEINTLANDCQQQAKQIERSIAAIENLESTLVDIT